MQQQQQQQPPQHHQALSPPQQQQQQQPPSPRRPAGPPADVTLSTVQSSNCSPSGAQISQCVKKMHDECFQQLASNPVRKKELEDCSKRLGQLCWRLNEKQVSAAVEEKLMKLCDAASRGDWATANSVHVEMTTQHWDECSGFLTALKRLLKTRSAL
jgi:protein transport protein SEC31